MCIRDRDCSAIGTNPEQRHEIDPLSEEAKVEANSISASDEQLIRKALDMVEKNLSNPEYSIEDLR